jgi:prepilin-type N-terminal cleavage/methylation domain-containing protein
MRLGATDIKSPPRAGVLPVDWHDCAWTAAIVVQPPSGRRPAARRRRIKPLPAASPILHIIRRSSYNFNTMKISSLSGRRSRPGFTLIELLVVIAIIGILAAMLLAVLPRVFESGQKTKARLEAQAIATAIEQYDSAYGRFPVSAAVQKAAGSGDFTYGGSLLQDQLVPTIPADNIYTTNNSEVIAILMDITNTTVTAVNKNHEKNPQETRFLSAKMSGWDLSMGGKPQPGVGNDLVYRDPWGNPYVISMDLNYDDQTEDAFYRLNAVSHGGLNGLTNPDGANATTDKWQYHGKVMVWSAGPKGKIDPTDPATDLENKNNVLSWK